VKAFIEACFSAATEIVSILQTTDHSYGCAPQSRGAGGDVSIGYDMLAEASLVKYLSPFGQILSEESGYIGEGDDLIIIDPIDGSDNLKSKFPYYGTSIALQINNKTVAGFVCNFANGDCFIRDTKSLYRRSLFNQSEYEEVTVNPHSKIGIFEKAALYPESVRKLIDNGLKFRSPGAVALSLAYAHTVKYVVFLGNIRTYDVAAGLYLCEDLYTYVSDDIFIVSHNKDVFAKILTIFNLTDSTA